MSRVLPVLLASGAALLASTPALADFDLVDASGLQFFFSEDVTWLTWSAASSSASGAATEASYTQAPVHDVGWWHHFHHAG